MLFGAAVVNRYDEKMPEAETILIKKYENRRLYNTANSRYVNLDEVASLLRQGHDVRVVDALSGQDITRLVLTQIIVEDAKAPDSTFPLEVLRQMVVSSGRATQAGTRLYMQAFADIYEKSFRALTPAFPFPQAATAGGGSATDSPPAEEKSTLDDMKRRLAELEELVSNLSPDGSARRK